MWILLIAITYCDDDLAKIKFPEDAVERRASYRPEYPVTQKRAYFVDDRLVGERKFYKSGRLADERLYRNEKLHGVWRQWHENGKLLAERPYREGQMDGTFRFWDSNGKLLGESEMNRGTGVLHEFENLPLVAFDTETPYLGGKENGWRRYRGRFKGRIGVGSNISRLKNGVLDGYSYLYDGDGLPLGGAFFKDGELHGYAGHTDRDGTPAEGYPSYRINGNTVAAGQYVDAAKRDKLLQEILEHKPPKLEDIPTGVIDPDAKQPDSDRKPPDRK